MNRLAEETSPYLRQHKDNPVDWYPWGDEAFARAKAEDKPVLLSVGYSACHWCHVMAHESFEDPAVAAVMNELFVNVKVDREERPDVDSIYMEAVQALTGHGGWPMTVFLTPDKRPFYGGTYYPKEPRHGMPGFVQVIQAINEAWRERRHEVDDQAGRLTQAPRYRQVLDETVGYALRDLRHPDGGLYSAEDADSEGEEGKFYVWRPEEIKDVLGPDEAPAALEWWGVTTSGNFEGANILHRPPRGDLVRPPH